MPHNAVQKAIALDRDATFQTAPADHDSPSANGGLLYFTAENFDNVRQAQIANRNYKKRPAAEHPMLPALKSASEGSLESYLYGAASNAAEGAAATRILLDEVLLGALGGETLGRAAGLAGGTAAAPTCDTTTLDSQATYSWGYFVDTSAAATGMRRFRKFSTITDGGVGNPDTINMLSGHNLPFTPDAGGADTMLATVVHFPYWDAMEDHSHANHYTHTLFRKGRHAEDSCEPLGVKFGLGQIIITAGERSVVQIPFKAANFTDPESITQPDLTGTPSGVPGKTVGSGTQTICELQPVGTNLHNSTRHFWGSITVNLGITYSAYDGPNGQEGVHGWGVEEGAYEAQTVEMIVPFDDDWLTAFRADPRTPWHMLVQVGTTATNVWGIYFPRLSFAEEPQFTAHNGRKALTLRFKCLEDDTIDVSALTEPAVSRAKAKFELLRVG